MDFDLPDDHELIRRTVRDFAEGEVAPVAEELDRTKTFPYEIVRKLGDLGLMGMEGFGQEATAVESATVPEPDLLRNLDEDVDELLRQEGGG